MENKEKMPMYKYTKILVPASSYDVAGDARLLIPFTNGDKIGFADHDGNVIVKPRFSMYYGDCYDETDYIVVRDIFTYGVPWANGNVYTNYRPTSGLINFKGEMIFETTNFRIIRAIGNKSLYTIENGNHEFGVVTVDGKVIVPFGKYFEIDGFDNGLARVNIRIDNDSNNAQKKLWGIINEQGEEVLPLEYDDIWNFYGKERNSTTVVKDGIRQSVKFSSLLGTIEPTENPYTNYDNCYGGNYGEYAGTYAQDVAGYDDDTINDAFDGDPDAYWNID